MNCEVVLSLFVTLKTKNLFPRNDEIDPTKNDKKFDPHSLVQQSLQIILVLQNELMLQETH